MEFNHHVGSLDFGQGINPYSFDSATRNLVMDGSTKDEWTSSLAFLETYDEEFGIYNHNDENFDPLAIMGMHPAEDPVTGSRMQLLIREIIAYRLPELTNTPLLELLNYPRWFLDPLIKDGRKARLKDDKEVEEVEKKLDKDEASNTRNKA